MLICQIKMNKRCLSKNVLREIDAIAECATNLICLGHQAVDVYVPSVYPYNYCLQTIAL